MVRRFVGDLEQHSESKLECSYSRAVDLGLDTTNTSNVTVGSSAIWPVKLSASILEDGTSVLKNASGTVLAKDRTEDHSIIADSTLERLHQAWTDCTSTIRK